ncbi:MAG: lactate utilization protein [Anaerolineae bacterium]|nr:lactate utilization protein [Anaerolineae bacterium]
MSQVQQESITAASEETLERVAEAMRARNIEVIVVDNGDEARQVVLERVPKGAEVHTGKSKTLQDAGIFDALHDTEQYNSLRHKYMAMDRRTQADEIRKLTAAPDYMLGSVNAVTEAGILVAVSATASQLGAYAYTAGKVILVVGSQKIVPDLDAALKRGHEYVLPWEEAELQKRLPDVHTFVGKTLIIEREWQAGRMLVVLVREPIGV